MISAATKLTTGITIHEPIVIGARTSGICSAIKHREAKTDFLVLEKANEVGGVWCESIYPDCACDVPLTPYSYSFAPKPNWRRVLASQANYVSTLKNTPD